MFVVRCLVFGFGSLVVRNERLEFILELLTMISGPLVGLRCMALGYKGTSLIRKRLPVGPYSSTLPKVLGRS